MKNTKDILLALCLLILAAVAIYIPLSSSFHTPFTSGTLADGQLRIVGNMDHDVWVWLDEMSEL